MPGNVYILEWFGPFSSPASVIKWENENSRETYLYLFKGKKKYAKTHEGMYCGQAWKQTAGERLSNKKHHINDFIENEEQLTIFVAEFSNLNPKKHDVNLCEKLLTSVIDQVECDDKLDIVNLTNTHGPKERVYLINEWYKPDGEPWKNYRRNSICSHIHDLIVCYPDDKDKSSHIWGNKRIKYINDIQ